MKGQAAKKGSRGRSDGINAQDSEKNFENRLKASSGSSKQRVNVGNDNIPAITQPKAPGISVPDILMEPERGGV